MDALGVAVAVMAAIGAGTGTAALVLVLRARPRAARPRVSATIASARHTRTGTDTSLAATLVLANEGDAPARVHLAEAEVEAFVPGAIGLRSERRAARASLAVHLAPGARERVQVRFELPDALVPDGPVPISVQVVHERGNVTVVGTTRGASEERP